MPRHKFITALTLWTALLSSTLTTTAQESATFNSRVIPTPQHVERSAGAVRHAQRQRPVCQPTAGAQSDRRTVRKSPHYYYLFAIPVDSLAGVTCNMEQAYRLVVKPDAAYCYYVAPDGLRYAQQTLDWLWFAWPDSIPCMEITDWPALTYRGWLDDISRGPVPNADFSVLQNQLTYRVKMNFASYYTEHTAYNPRYCDIAPRSTRHFPPRSTATPLPWMANLQCFAHFEKTLRIPFYQYLMDTPSNLNPGNEATYRFLDQQIRNLMQHYPDSKFFNINCDETEALGAGLAHHYVDSVGATEAYCRHINRVYELLKPYHCQVLMWGDIVGKDPAMLQRLPRDMQYIVWNYGAQTSYADQISPFREALQRHGTPFWVAPGVSHWSTLPQVHNYIQNIAYLARDGYQAGARGLINTAWDDSGESLFSDCWHAMLWAAEMAWHPVVHTDPLQARQELDARQRQFNANYNRALAIFDGFTTATPSLVADSAIADYAAAIYAVGNLCDNPAVGDWVNTSALQQPLLRFYPDCVSPAMWQRCATVDSLINHIAPTIDSARLPHYAYALQRIQTVAAKSRLRYLLHQALLSPSDDALDSARRYADRYFSQLHRLKIAYLHLWDDECTDYSRQIICDRYDQLGCEVQQAFTHVFHSVAIGADGKPVVTLRTLDDAPIYYTLDGRTPTSGAPRYVAPLTLERSGTLRALAYSPTGQACYTEQYILCHHGMGQPLQLRTPYSTYRAEYSGGGDQALADGLLGADDTYADGHWQGYWGTDIDVAYTFAKPTAIDRIEMRFFQHTFDWILAPQQVHVYTSDDGERWTRCRTVTLATDPRRTTPHVEPAVVDSLHLTTQHLRVVVPNAGALPAFHSAHGEPSYLFLDEIVIH